MPPPALFCALCCGLLAVSARAGYSEDRCSWRGSGLTQEPGSVGQLTLACVEGAIEWLYPAGALRLTLGAPDFGTRPGITCLRPARPFAGAQVFAEREGGSLELLLTEGPGLAGGRCVHWGPRERRALFLQATPHRDISRRVAAFRFELREDRSPELPPQVHGLGEDGLLLFGSQKATLGSHRRFPNAGACRPCSDEELLLAACTSDFGRRSPEPAGELWAGAGGAERATHQPVGLRQLPASSLGLRLATGTRPSSAGKARNRRGTAEGKGLEAGGP
ncbi:meteorin, glial cell differentiation regulator, transcript variant X5 [Ictidomys tridecemlineatus]|nr:meteorin, glial cell differentiation regulator, transcript variant X5 [Ictidomys tridecemlineatus]